MKNPGDTAMVNRPKLIRTTHTGRRPRVTCGRSTGNPDLACSEYAPRLFCFKADKSH